MKGAILHIISILFLAVQIGQAQDYISTQYTKEDGLPSDYCYNVIQDEEGLLWISTEVGMCTFDGQNFKTNIFPELGNKEVIEIYKDSWDRLWMVELSGEIFYIENGELKQLEYPDNWSSKLFANVTDDQNGNIWINVRHKPYAYGFDAETLELKYSFNTLQQQIDLLQTEGYPLHAKTVEVKGKNISIIDGEKKIEFKEFNIYSLYSNHVDFENAKSYFTTHNNLIEHDLETGSLNRVLQKQQTYIDKGIRHFTTDRHDNIWVVTKEGVFRISSPFSEDSQIDEYFLDANIQYVYVDNQDNIWLTSSDQGLIKLCETTINSITDKNAHNITRLIYHHEHLIYGTSKGEIIVLDKENKEVLREKIDEAASQVYGLKRIDENRLLITTDKKIHTLDLSSMEIILLKSSGFFKSATMSLDKENIWINGGESNYFCPLEFDKHAVITPELRSYSCLPITEETAYIGSVSGLFKSHIDGSAEPILPTIIQDDVREICEGNDGNIWVATHGNGIFILQADTLVKHLITFPSKHIRDIIKDKNKMWVATNNGLCVVTKIKQNYNVKVIDKSDGLISEQINSLSIHAGNIYAASTKGISIVDKKFQFDDELPIVKVNTIKINERDTTISNTFELNSKQRNIKIDFGGILFNKHGSIKYKYMMVGLDSDWVFTDQTNAQYPSLPPGKYSFLLKAKSLNSRWTEVEKIDFKIAKKISETLIYKIFLATLSLVLLLLAFNFFSRSREKSRNFKLSQMTALRAQMNPHFIFNSLNSVQDYILRDDKVAANKYISKFSKLMRYILNASEKEFTNLKQELHSLEVYMSIESMRFDNALLYSIEVSDKLEPEKYMIPTMILQPYIENAINHGLKHSNGEKKLIMRVRKYNAGLMIEIEDNGVGRIKARKIKLREDNNYDSKGTLINQQRIDLLNKHYQKENKVTFKDIYDKDKNPTGTKVEIFLQSIKFS